MTDLTADSRARGAPRRVRRGLLGVLIASFGVLLLAGSPAHADNEVVTSDPADGSILDVSPMQIVITFTEDLGEQNNITLQCGGEAITLPRADVGDDDRTLSVQIAEPVGRGGCVAGWAVSNPDNEPNGSGNITFTVQNDSAPETTVSATTTSTTPAEGEDITLVPVVVVDVVEVTPLDEIDTGRGPLWLGRLLSTLGIAVLFGGLVTIAAAWPEGVEYLLAVRFLRTAWIVALFGTVLYVAAGAAAVTDSGLGSGFGPGAWIDLADAGWPGRAALARLLLVVLSAWVAFRPDRVIDPTTQLAALGIPALAVATIGFTRVGGDLPWLGVAVGVVHALAMAVWVGGAVLVGRVVLAGPGEEDLVHAVRGFTRISTPAILITVISGLVQMVRLDGGELFSSPHGRVVVLKSIVVALMVFVAISARQFVSQRMSRANEMSVPLADRLQRAFGAEAAIGVVVLALSAWLVALDPPNIDTTPRIDYEVSRTFDIPEGDLDVTVKLTRDTVGSAGMEVQVRAPENGLSGLEVILTAPPNETIGTITQPVPNLTGAGVAVRLEQNGIPLTIAGDWTVQVNAVTPAGVVNTAPLAFTIRNADGSVPTTEITIPPVSTITLPDTTPE
ncbi:MAG: copper resistance CopC/CopD family protein [Ilumatobacteraceae bacterium]